MLSRHALTTNDNSPDCVCPPVMLSFLWLFLKVRWHSDQILLPSLVFCPVGHRVKKWNIFLSSFFFLLQSKNKGCHSCALFILRDLFFVHLLHLALVIVTSLWLLLKFGVTQVENEYLLCSYLYMRGMLVWTGKTIPLGSRAIVINEFWEQRFRLVKIKVTSFVPSSADWT